MDGNDFIIFKHGCGNDSEYTMEENNRMSFSDESKTKMKKHCDKNILEILREPHIEQDLSAIHNNGMAAGPHGKFEKKVGEDAPPSIYELVNIVKFLQYLKKVPENSTFVIVSAMEKIFIVTLR